MNHGCWPIVPCILYPASSIVLAAQSELSIEEQTKVEFWLAVIGGLLFVLIAALLVLAVAIRYIAKHSTRPCPWCMEFIPKRETVCPRCGKGLGQAGAVAQAAGSQARSPSAPRT
jgi:hypothetical protein